MSFAQGLLAGTQAARNVMDSYKEARDARVQREFAQGLAELDEQQKQGQAGLQDYYSGANTERFAEVPTQAPTQFNQGLMPEAVPQAPMTPEQMVQQQLALANRLGLRQEAGNYTNQLNALRQQQMEQSRYDQQGLFNEQKFEADEAFRRDQLAAQETEAKSQAAFRAAQTAGLTQTQQQQAADRAASEAALKAANDVSAALLSGNSIFAGFEDAKKLYADNPAALNAYSRAVYDKFRESTGLSEGDIYKSVDSVTAPLSQFINTSYDDPTKMLAGFQKVLDSIDPDLTDNIRPEPVPRPDGTWAIKYGDAEIPGLEGKDLQDVAAKYMTIVQRDPMEAVSIYERNKNSQLTKLAAAKDASEQRKLLADILKANPELLRDENAAGRILDTLNMSEGGLGFEPGQWGQVDMSQSDRAILAQVAKQMGAPVEPATRGSETVAKQAQDRQKTAEDKQKFAQDVEAMTRTTAEELDALYGDDLGGKARAVREALTTPGISLVEEAALRELYRQSYLR
jgi:hypothetical protein